MKLNRVVRLVLLWSPVFAGWQVTKWEKDLLQLRWRKASSVPIKVAFRIAVPAGSRLRLSHRIIEERPCSNRASETGELAGNLIFHETGRGRFRDTEVASLAFNARYRGETGCMEVRHLELSAAFLFQDGFRASGWRTAFPEAERSPAERLLKNFVVNYQQSRIFRTVPLQGARFSKRAFSNAQLPARRLKIFTSSEKIHVVTYKALKNIGLPLKNIDPRKMRLFYGESEIPLFIHGEDDGKWDSGDYIEFIGRRPLGTLMQSGKRAYNSFYTQYATLILVWEMQGWGHRAPLIPVAGDFGGVVWSEESALPQAGPYPVSVHLEEDEEVLRLGGVEVADVLDLGVSAGAVQMADFWHWKRQGPDLDVINIPFTLNHTPSGKEESDSSRMLHVTVEMRGLTDVLTAQFDHHVKFLINSVDISQIGKVENTAKWAGSRRHVWRSTPLDQRILLPGKNVFTIQKINDLETTSGELVKVQDAYLNFLELRFFADFRVVDDELTFSCDYPAQQGPHMFILKNLTGNDYCLWDKGGRKLVGFNLFTRGKEKQLSFSDNIVSKTTYTLASKEKRLFPTLELDSLDDLMSVSNQADYLIITQKDMLGSSLDSLISLRSTQGLNCRVVIAEHIYQSFGDGAPDPEAIRKFVRFAYLYWKRPAPLYLLLAGESSLWFKKMTGRTQVDVVPTHLIHIPGWGITSNDDYYAKIAGDDQIADILVGRLPVADKKALGDVVAKIHRHENSRKPGHWQNKILLLSGYEPNFTETSNVVQKQIVQENRQFSRLDVESNSPYRRSLDIPPSVFSQLDSAFNLVSFVGHGGGAVWSDAGLLTLDELDSLRGPHSIPMVLSITCLTGYFEDIAAPSLGEELVRKPLGGAVAFYGASGYISTIVGNLLVQELIKTALSQNSTTAGNLVQTAENNLLLSTNGKFASITGEFDLLGDPALRIGFPEVAEILTISHRLKNDIYHVEVAAEKLKMSAGQGVITVILDDSITSSKRVSFSNGEIQETVEFRQNGRLFSRGKAIFHYWNEDESRVAVGDFSGLDWMIVSLESVPPLPAIGDSIKIRFKLRGIPGKIVFNGGAISYKVAQKKPLKFDPGREILLVQKENAVFESINPFKLALDTSNVINPNLYIRVRMSFKSGDNIVVPGFESNVMALGMENPSDLTFLDKGFAFPIQDELGVWVRFINKGQGYDSNFQIILESGGLKGATKADTAVYSKTLEPNRSDSVFFHLDDSVFNSPIRVSIRSVLENREHNVQNNSADTVFAMLSKMLKNGADTLWLSERLGLYPGKEGFSGRVFASRISCPNQLPSHLRHAHLDSSGPVCHEILPAVDASIAPLRLWAVDAVSGDSASESLGWHYFVAGDDNWIALEKPQGNLSRVEARTFGPGVYSVLFNGDHQKPVVQFTARGQLLQQDDFVPRKAPIEITLRDNAGVDFLKNKPSISFPSGRDSSNIIIRHSGSLSKTGLIRLEPFADIQRDSFQVIVNDISGNTVSLPFIYRVGSELKVIIYGNYPNPFADTTIIVYQLTDWVESLQLKIFSRSGRLVRSFSGAPQSGYNEIVWDGRTQSGREIANGLYYLKILAERKGKKVSGTLKLFKKKRK